MRQEKRQAFKGLSLFTCVITSEDDSQKQNKNASTELVALINEWADSFINSRKLVIMIIEQAQKEGLSSVTLRMLIEFALKKRGISRAQIGRLIPSELKDSSKIHVADSESRAHLLRNDDKNELEESYNDDEDEAQVTGEDLPVLQEPQDLGYLHKTEQLTRESLEQLTIDEFLSKEADGETKFYFENISINMAKTELLTRKGLQTFRRLYFEI